MSHSAAEPRAIQDFYHDDIAICVGCGRHNPQTLGVRTFWDGAEGVCHFTPADHHTAFPGVVYGGLLACLVDCHSIGTAIAAMYDAEGRAPGTEPEITCVTASLQVDYLKPTPMGVELELRTSIEELSARKAILRCSLRAGDEETVRGRVVAVRVRSRAGGGDAKV
ncbi:MAG: PaaI family thioesterase [Anaerolineaceae bacterium]|nr:PaaI family thioesterase [Anaerolineaceae bacterium]MDE0328730.1 PaaI family thioesterase [Anaerolineaceae bacterium]